MSSRARTVSLLGIGVIIGASASLGLAAFAARDARPLLAWQSAQLFAEVYEHIKQDYVEDVSEISLIEGAIRGQLSGLDQYSAYLNPEEFAEMRMSTSGAYSGVGVEIALVDSTIRVIAALEGSPAERAGILPGDTVVAVDDMQVRPDSVNEAIERMRGQAGTTVKLTIERQDTPQRLDVIVTRGNVQVQSVKRELLEPGVAYVRINQFNENTAADFSREIATLQREGSLRGLLLDLRNNPGGVLDGAVAVADALLESGVIVTATGRTDDSKFSMQAHDGDLMKNAPIVVLVNGGSASAAEIVAGALKDHRRAVLVGQKTYGKGSVQSVLPLSSGGALKLTTSHYHTPSGSEISERGIEPDVTIANLSLEAPEAPSSGGPRILREDPEVRLALKHLRNRL